MTKILVYGYGNPGRQDDGLGVLFTEKLESWANQQQIKSLTFNSNYQLNIEDAYKLNEFDKVIFADASKEEIEHFKLEKIIPDIHTNFSMHSVSPAFIIALCLEIYQSIPEAYQLHIKGYEWEFMEPLSQHALQNLNKASEFIQQQLLQNWVS